jgi:hypothetical protein
MTRSELLSNVNELFKEALEIMDIKQKMYASEQNAYHNFKVVRYATGVDIKTQILARMFDKLNRIKHIEIKGGDRDTVTDCVIDLINYAALYLFVEE